MGIFQVMKNNLRRNFQAAGTWLFLILVPLIISLLGVVDGMAGKESIRVGVYGLEKTVIKQPECLNQGSLEAEILEKLAEYKMVQYEAADKESVYTDEIMGKYQYILDFSGDETSGKTDGRNDPAAVFSKISQEAAEKERSQNKSMDSSQRKLAFLVTAYLVIGTIYAGRYIRDREEGTLSRYQFCGNKEGSYLLGYYGSVFVILVVQNGAALLLWKLIDKTFSLSLLEILLKTVSISAVSALLALIIVRISKKELHANILAASLSVIFALLGGTFVSISSMPGFLQAASLFSPVRWLVQ